MHMAVSHSVSELVLSSEFLHLKGDKRRLGRTRERERKSRREREKKREQECLSAADT